MKIISTIGPASLNARFVRFCTSIGQPNFRINGSHLSVNELESILVQLEKFSGRQLPEITLDIQGGKKRIGILAEPLHLEKNEWVSMVEGADATALNNRTQKIIPLPEWDSFRNLPVGSVFHLQDNQIQLQIKEVHPHQILAKVVNASQPLRSRAGIWLKGQQAFPLRLPQNQIEQIQVAAKFGIKNIALSFVSQPADLLHLRKFVESINYTPHIIAKIERPEALEHLAHISKACNSIWFCRGDLGTMVPLKELGKMQDLCLHFCKINRIPIFIAGQVFHHLTDHEHPTRSEVVHFYHLNNAGASGIVLSDETAIGVNPINAVSQISQLL